MNMCLKSFAQEDAIEIYAETHAQSANSAAAAVTVATISESRGALAKMPLRLRFCCMSPEVIRRY